MSDEIQAQRDQNDIAAGQVRETRGGTLHIERDLGDGWWRVSWYPPAPPDDPPLTDRLHESKISVYPLVAGQ